MLRPFFIVLLCIGLWCSAIGAANAATSLPFAVNMSEVVIVDTGGGTPRIAVNVGGVTRYASYASGTGTNTLTFTYAAVAGDVDLDGITVTSPIDLNGGTIKDASGNDSALTFALPVTTGVNVDYPSLSMNFINGTTGRYTLSGTAYTTLSSFLTAAGGSFSRASTATYFDSTGTLQTASSGSPRFDHDPVTLVPKGILIEEPRINYIKNSQFSGITTGGPYTTATTLGTHWQTMGAGGFTSSSITITGTGTANGIPYLDLRFQGTNSSGVTGYITFNTIAADKFPAVTGDRTIISAWMAITSYTSTGGAARVHLQTRSYTGAAAYAGGAEVSYGSTIPWQKVTTAALTHGATAASADGWMFVSAPNGTTLDITVRLGGIQVEKAAFATSYIPTTNGIVTRAVESLSMPTGAWFNATEGTFYASILPTANYANYPQIGLFGDGTSTNFIAYTLFPPSNSVFEEWKEGAITLFNLNAGLAPIGSITEFAGAYKNGMSALSRSGTAPVTSAATLSTSLPINLFSIGSNIARGGTDGRYSGTIGAIKYYPSRVPNTQLQLLTQ